MQKECNLTLNTLWANSAENKLVIFFSSSFFFPERKDFDIFLRENLHQLSKPLFWKIKYFIMSPDEFFTQHAKR